MLKNKRGVSLVVSYILLIVLSLALAIYVFNWLKGFVPSLNEAECPEGVSLIIKGSNYDFDDQLTLTVENRGRFSADGYFVRANNQTEPNFGVYVLNRTGIKMLVGQINTTLFNSSTYLEGTDVKDLEGILHVVEIQPFVYQKGHSGPVMCDSISKITDLNF